MMLSADGTALVHARRLDHDFCPTVPKTPRKKPHHSSVFIVKRNISALGQASNPAHWLGAAARCLGPVDCAVEWAYRCLCLQKRARETGRATCSAVSFVRKQWAASRAESIGSQP